MGSSLCLVRGVTAAVAVSVALAAPARVAAQAWSRPDVSFGGGLVRQPDDNSGLLSRTGMHLQGSVRAVRGERVGARVAALYQHFDVRSTGVQPPCHPAEVTCPFEPQRLPYSVGVLSASIVGKAEAHGRVFGGAGIGMHHAFRSPWGGERGGLAINALLGAKLGSERRGLGVEASIHHLIGNRSGSAWLMPLGLNWTF
ncbi:MAG TPA: hypothetical protein VMM18_00940 [Gemmatimonadaceae bacterium]|nr:hypothetical protein [Gemmatimonadaceae bacterium]